VKVDQATGSWRFRLTMDQLAPEEEKREAQVQIDKAIDRGMEYLLATQQRDGSWGFKAGEFPGGQTALSVYALLKSGLSARHIAIQRGVTFLQSHSPQRTYAIGCTLLALSALPG
jgi:hypothetical protein